jgi:LuxR family maltose regulon positive regulatory protein
MATPLLATKLYIPPFRPNLVPRPRLIERLDEGRRSARKLTLLSAPAGYGKTTLLSEWLQSIGAETPPTAVAWLSLDEGDNDLSRFLSYTIAALGTVEPGLAEGVLSALQSPQPPPAEEILIALINEIATLPGPILLILDDYHLVDTGSVHDALGFLLRHLPPTLHLVIATRDDPPLRLSRFRARGQMIELRAVDLRFTVSEAAEFLNQMMGLGLEEGDVDLLARRTEGWIAGLQLAAISMQGRGDSAGFIASFSGSHRYVLDYLIEEVLEQQPAGIQAFLLHTAVLERLTASLCDAVRFGASGPPTEEDGAQAILERLENANLFIVPLDEERRWYRYHHLFADLLRRRLPQVEPEGLSRLRHRASLWYEGNGFIDEAIGQALHAGDFERAAGLIEDHVDAQWQRGEPAKTRHWLAQLPTELVLSSPHLCILNAWDLFLSGRQDAAERYLRAAEGALAMAPDPETGFPAPDRDRQPGANRIGGRVAAVRAFLAFHQGDVPAIDRYARRALELLPAEDLTWRSTAAVALGDAYSFMGQIQKAYRARSDALEASKAAGNLYMILIAGMKLAVAMRQLGQLEETIQLCRQQFRLADDGGLSQAAVAGWILAIWGEVLAELGDLDAAKERGIRGVELVEQGKDVAMIGWSYHCLIRILFSRGELAAAEEVIRKMAIVVPASRVPPWIANLLAAWQARIWLARGEGELVSQWVGDRGLVVDGDVPFLRETEHIVLTRILLAQDRLDEATPLMGRLLAATEAGSRTSRSIELLILQALALQSTGRTAQAIAVLERVLSLAEPGGFVRIFVDEGPPVAGLLVQALSQGIRPAYIRRLLAAFPDAGPDQTGPSESVASDSVLIEPLSAREIEILQLIADGLTNPEIAAKLFLSPNTVKVHARNIYGKLGVHNRAEAVVRAIALGILSSP